MDLFAGQQQQALSQQAHILAHLAACDYCRTAVVVLLGIAQECVRRNGDPLGPAHDLRERFVRIGRELEASAYERMGAYAEAIVAEGREMAELRFPDTTAHLRSCLHCRSALESTVAFLNEPEEID